MITYNIDGIETRLQCSNCQNLWDVEKFKDEIGINDNVKCPACGAWQDYEKVDNT